MISLLFLLTLLLSPQYVVRTSTGFTVKLIHPTSPESPFYNRNLTNQERLRELVNHSTARAHTFASMIINHNKTKNSVSRRLLRVQPLLRAKSPMGILVDLELGTIPGGRPHAYFLNMDTASELTWLQCEACRQIDKCFPQRGPPFPNSKSTTYVSLSYGHNLCYPNSQVANLCTYRVNFQDKLQSVGYLSSESFTFMSNSGGTEIVNNIVFGCGIDNEGHASSGIEAGTFGLGWGPRSIVSQLRYQTDERFSYCFPHLDQIARLSHSYLKFGNDINYQYQGSGFQHTSLLQVGAHQHYYLPLQGISVANRRLAIPPTAFVVRADGSGGMIIDTGTHITHLVSTAFTQLVLALDTYMAEVGNTRTHIVDNDVCYTIGQGPKSKQLPNIMLHFTGATFMDLPPKNVFFKFDNGEMYCLAMQMSAYAFSILGSYQQSNIRFIYDRLHSVLAYKPENCGAQ